MEKSGLEIERKFLIEKYTGEIQGEIRWDIVQTYLIKGEDGAQRRVRKITENGEKTSFFYTEKKFLTDGIREENEREITEEEYNTLLEEADKTLSAVVKTRRIFSYGGHTLEMDEYPFSEKFASVEAELSDINEEVSLPEYLHVIKEVTGDGRYSNAKLALNRCFPDEMQ